MTKKIFIAALFSLTAYASQAQFILSGRLGFMTTKTEATSTRQTDVTVLPRLAYGLNDNIIVGVDAGVLLSKMKATNVDDVYTRSTSFVASPFVRYVKKFGAMGAWAEAGAGVGFGRSKVKNGSIESNGPKTFNFGANLRPGVIFYVSDQLSFEASYGALGFNQTNSEGDKVSSSFGFNLNPNTFGFAVNYAFN